MEGIADICIVYGGIIAVAVSMAKRVRFIARNPKIVAAILSAMAAAIPVLKGGAPFPDIAALLNCFAIQFVAAVGTYEVGIKWIQQRVGAGEIQRR